MESPYLSRPCYPRKHPRLKADGNLDFLGFMDEIYVLMRAIWGEEAPLFTMIKPDVTNSRDIPMPQIIYSLASMEPGIVGNEQTREIKPRFRESLQEISPVTNKPVQVEYWGQLQDCLVTFTIYASSNEEAFYWTEKFRLFLYEYKGYFMQQGVANLWFRKEEERNNRENSKAYFASRELTYLVRIEEIHRKETQALEGILLDIGVTRNFLEGKELLPSQRIASIKIGEPSLSGNSPLAKTNQGGT